MLRDFPKIMLLMLMGTLVVLMIVYYGQNQYKQDSTIQTLQETLRTTAITNRDDSSRVTKGTFYIDRGQFEQDFKEKYARIKNTQSEASDYNFEYLENPIGGIKAIKVKVKIGGQRYQATCILDVANDDEKG